MKRTQKIENINFLLAQLLPLSLVNLCPGLGRFVCVDKHISTHLFVGPDKTLPTFCPFCVCILDSTINTREDANTCDVLARSWSTKNCV